MAVGLKTAVCWDAMSCRRKQQVPLKCWYVQTSLYWVTSQMPEIFGKCFCSSEHFRCEIICTILTHLCYMLVTCMVVGRRIVMKTCL